MSDGYLARARANKSKRFKGFGIILLPFIGFVLLFILIFGYNIAFSVSRGEAGPCLVDDKDRTSYEGESDMRVYTDCGVFQVGDNLLAGKFNSADTFSQIKIGETYYFKTYGWRLPILSQFPVILEVSQ